MKTANSVAITGLSGTQTATSIPNVIPAGHTPTVSAPVSLIQSYNTPISDKNAKPVEIVDLTNVDEDTDEEEDADADEDITGESGRQRIRRQNIFLKRLKSAPTLFKHRSSANNQKYLRILQEKGRLTEDEIGTIYKDYGDKTYGNLSMNEKRIWIDISNKVQKGHKTFEFIPESCVYLIYCN
jgi:hypothetical protein